MIFRQLGKTGLQISILGFGAAALGNEYGEIDTKEGERAVHRAIDLGINYFDTAPLYGFHLAEERLGRALIGKRNHINLATKAGRHAHDPASGFDFSRIGIIRSVEASLKRLRTEYIDVLQAHDIEFAPADLIVNETIPTMRRLQRQGKVRCVGITAYPLRILARVAKATTVDTILTYCRYNLFDTSMDDVLTSVAKQLGIGLINASALHMGLLTDTGPPDWHPAPQQVLAKGRQVSALCREHGADISQVALQFALAHADVATTLVGMSTTVEVERNVRAVYQRPDPLLLAEIKTMIEPVADIWWKEGLQENHDPDSVEQYC